MQIYSLGTIFVQLALGLNAFINAQGYAKTGMYTVLIGAICNIILDPILMFVFHMGVRGAALATIISQGISAAWVVLFLISNKSYLKIRTCFMRPKREILMPAIALGAAPFVMQFTESILNICFNTSLLKYGGDVAVGAMTIMGSVMQFSLLPLQGLTQGAQPIISFNYGAKKLDRVSRTFRLLLTSCMTYSTVLWAVAMFVPMVYIRIFTQDAALTAFSEWSIRIYMAASLLFGAQLACQQTFIAIGDSKTSLFLALLRKVILLIPLIYVLPNLFENKVFAVFVAEPIARYHSRVHHGNTVPSFLPENETGAGSQCLIVSASDGQSRISYIKRHPKAFLSALGCSISTPDRKSSVRTSHLHDTAPYWNSPTAWQYGASSPLHAS